MHHVVPISLRFFYSDVLDCEVRTSRHILGGSTTSKSM
jgi:hypothetical protein